jgi:hypothetical protein
MWQAPLNPNPITNQPQAFIQQGPYSGQPGQYHQGQPGPYPGQFPQDGYQHPMYSQQGTNSYGPQGYPPQQPGYGQMGIPMQQMGGGGSGGMLQNVMGTLRDVVDVDPMKQMHSTGNVFTGQSAPPLMPSMILYL